MGSFRRVATAIAAVLRRGTKELKTLSYILADTILKPARVNGASTLRWRNAGPNLALFWSGDDGYSCKSSLSRGAGSHETDGASFFPGHGEEDEPKRWRWQHQEETRCCCIGQEGQQVQGGGSLYSCFCPGRSNPKQTRLRLVLFRDYGHCGVNGCWRSHPAMKLRS